MNKPETQELQGLFDKSLNHIRRQGTFSIGASPTCPADHQICRYRDDHGRGCAAAPFIIDYDEQMEGIGFGTLVKRWRSKIDPAAVRNVSFVVELQCCHDFSHGGCNTDPVAMSGFMRQFERQMKALAERFFLKYEPPK